MHAMQLLSSMLWAFKGQTRSAWTMALPEEADVIVFHRDDRDERLTGLLARGKLAVEIATTADRDSPGSRSLIYPFRAAQAFALLERLDSELAVGEGSGPVSQRDPWSFVNALRVARTRDKSDAWLVASAAEAPALWIRSGGTTYLAAPSTVQAIRVGALKLTALELRPGSPPADAPSPRPAAELCWFAAYHASDRLAPGLDASARYRMTRWPDFGAIRPASSQIRVVASLAGTEGNLAQISERAQVSVEEATRTLNALVSCGFAAAADVGTHRAIAARSRLSEPQPRGGLATFLQNFRKHLGLGVPT